MVVLVPLAGVFAIGLYSRKYIRDVTDFLSAGRVCGRYVISVADLAAGLSILGVVAYVEVHYKTGFAVSFWNMILLPIGTFLGLMGYCTYRFRETKAQSAGQFIEMRYSRKLRIFTSVLKSFSGIMCSMIMPAVAARFFICFLDLPQKITFFGFELPTFNCVMFLILAGALTIIWSGGLVAIIVTDTVQGFLCYPLLVIFIIFILVKFSWGTELVPVMMDRSAGESFLNPYDVYNLRDFNLFYLIVVLAGVFLHKASWIGGGTSTSARSPQEQKMAGLLGVWRGALSSLFYVLIAVSILTMMNHKNYADEAGEVRSGLASKAVSEVIADEKIQAQVSAALAKLPVQKHEIGAVPPLSDKKNLDTPFLDTVHTAFLENSSDRAANSMFQKFRTLYYQLMMPAAMRKMLPEWMFGLFCLLMIVAMISTDTTQIFIASLSITQDIVLPLRKPPFSMRQHIWSIRWAAAGVAAIYFISSSFMAQMDYIQLFITIMGAIWLGGCGPVMILGLYSRFGTTAGAWTSLISGTVMSIGGILLQRNWADHVYPWLDKYNLTEPFGTFLDTVSKPLNPYVVWKMDAVKFPVNSYEIYFITMMTTLFLYCAVSWLTYRTPFNLERMLHRGKYSIDGKRNLETEWSMKTIFSKLLGITPEYTRGDKVIAWSFFLYSFIYTFLLTFIMVIIWNFIVPWPLEWWGYYFLVVSVIVPGIMALITAVWFGIGGGIDLYRMFRDLETRVRNSLDDGRVEGQTSLSDKDAFEKIDREKK